MKQTLQSLFTVALCTAAIFATAQSNTSKLLLKKGQKLQMESTVQSVSSMELMGQSMDITADAVTTRQFEVKDKKDKSYVVTSTTTRMNINSSMMGQSMAYDSDKKEDSTSEMGKMMKGEINVPKEMELDEQAKLISAKKEAPKASAEGGNPITSMMESMGAGQDESNGANEAFLLVPAGAKAGTTWSDSAIVEGSKTYRTYSVKSIQGNDATITLSGTQSVNKTVENQGMEATVALESKLSGEILVDIATGIVKQRSLTLEGAGTTEAMGQSIPMTTKVTTSSVVKSL